MSRWVASQVEITIGGDMSPCHYSFIPPFHRLFSAVLRVYYFPPQAVAILLAVHALVQLSFYSHIWRTEGLETIADAEIVACFIRIATFVRY